MESFRSPSPAKCSNKREKKKYWPRGSTTIPSLLNVLHGVKMVIYVQKFRAQKSQTGQLIELAEDI